MRLPFFSQRRNVASDTVPPTTPVSKSPLEVVLQYHEETKHHYHHFARSLGYLDWANQPNPFRRFSGSRLVALPLLEQSDLPTYRDVFSPGVVPPVPVDLNSISRLFRNSLALSAWKHHDNSRWALRVNPSSGNLHPTEGYGILDDLTTELRAGVYHYAPQIHALEQRTELASGMFASLSKDFPAGSFFVGLTSIHWREAWKYGERAYRYCQHDLGHAIASLRLSAAVLGWQLLLLDELSDQEVALLLGLHVAENFEQAEDEYPHCISVVVPSADSIGNAATIRHEVIQKILNCSWTGRANRLSESHVDWQIVNVVAETASKLRTEICELRPSLMKFPPPDEIVSVEKIIQQRRSAVAMDGHTFLSSGRFFGMLARVISDTNAVPFDVFRRSELATPRIHLAVFVHRVTGIVPGLYFLIRKTGELSTIKESMHSNFLWQQVPDCPPQLLFYCLLQGDFKRVAASVSCGQEIAADGAFSLGMIAEFEDSLKTIGSWIYPRLFWEAGLVGQILYLEAEASGVRATGMGCYFDDPMHGLLGLKGNVFQSLYHFSVGGPVDDVRIGTEPAYGGSVDTISIPDLP